MASKIIIKNIIQEYLNDDYDFLFHGTSLENAENIMNYGFVEKTYWGNKNIAERSAYSYSKPVLIKIKKTKLDSLLEPNTTLLNFYEDNIDEDEDYENIINKWYNSNQTANDSLEIFDSVILPPNNIKINYDDIIVF